MHPSETSLRRQKSQESCWFRSVFTASDKHAAAMRAMKRTPVPLPVIQRKTEAKAVTKSTLSQEFVGSDDDGSDFDRVPSAKIVMPKTTIAIHKPNGSQRAATKMAKDVALTLRSESNTSTPAKLPRSTQTTMAKDAAKTSSSHQLRQNDARRVEGDQDKTAGDEDQSDSNSQSDSSVASSSNDEPVTKSAPQSPGKSARRCV